MAKRGAEEQLTLENFHLQDDIPDDQPKPSLATADVIAKRKILKPKGRLAHAAHSASSLTTASNFNASSAASSSSFLSNVEFDLKLSALNGKFVEAILAVGKAPLADYRPIAQKYITYYTSLEASRQGAQSNKPQPRDEDKMDVEPAVVKAPKTEKNAFANIIGSNQTEKKNPFAGISFGQASNSAKETPSEAKRVDVEMSSESENDEKKEIKIDGPKFTMSTKPMIKKSPFSFGSKPAKKGGEDSSDSEIEIKGPSFVFNKKISDPIFKISDSNKATTVENANTTSGNGLGKSFPGNGPHNSSEKPDEESKVPLVTTSMGSSFGNAGSSSNFLNVFNSAPAENLSFQNSSNNGTSKTPFEFGLSGTKESKPTFQFGATNSQSTSTKPAFQFGATNSQSTSAKPAFQFGAANTLSTSAKPSFQFGATDSKSTFLFGASTTAGENSLKFQFGTTSNNPAPAFSFGSNSVFNSGLQKFGQGPSESSPSIVTGSLKGDGLSQSKDDDLMPDEETGGDFVPVASLGTKKLESSHNGEENEKVLFHRKSKLMQLDTKKKENPYTNLGIGELKVLKNEVTKSTRILVRADGGLRVLLNVALLKDITYSTMGNGSLVQVPAVDSEGNLQTYVLKVKTPADGKELCDTLNQERL